MGQWISGLPDTTLRVNYGKNSFQIAECNTRSSDYRQGQPRVTRAKAEKMKQELSYYHLRPCQKQHSDVC